MQFKNKLFATGHKITCVDVKTDEDLIVCGSEDRTLCTFTIRQAKFLSIIYLPQVPELVRITPKGWILALCHGTHLELLSLNGETMASAQNAKRIYDLKVSRDGAVIVTGGESGEIIVRESFSLKIMRTVQLPTIIRSIALSSDDMFIFAGLENGEIFVLPLHSEAKSDL
jgi:WD40 repeat protein